MQLLRDVIGLLPFLAILGAKFFLWISYRQGSRLDLHNQYIVLTAHCNCTLAAYDPDSRKHQRRRR